ncbi:MAG: hypothetical protein IIA45_04340 [Bacteroidetes bacterium]|nr:hypothetical protein [Bacteroidota bacterium]
MKFFNFGKKDKILDLTNYKKQEEESEIENNSGELILDSGKVEDSEENDQIKDLDLSPDDILNKKKKFAKRISELTTTVEDLSNQIYHLQQRIELLEKKLSINRE